MIKIQGRGSYITDMAAGLKSEKLRETYIMDQLRMEILRGHLFGIEDRIKNARSMVKNPDNVALLSRMPEQAQKSLQEFKTVLPGTDLSGFSFKNEMGNGLLYLILKGNMCL